MSTETTQAETQAPRTFWHSDYRKMCDLLKSMRRGHCGGPAKSAESQVYVDQLAVEMAAVFATEAHASGTVFNVERFLKDTQLPQAVETTLGDNFTDYGPDDTSMPSE